MQKPEVVVNYRGWETPSKWNWQCFLSYGGVLKRVLHVPDLKAHLISEQKLVSDNGWRFTIDNDLCFLTDKVLKKKIGFIKRARELLLLEDQADVCFTLVHQATISRERKSICSIDAWDIHLLFS